MNNRSKLALFAAIIVLACGGCMTGLNEPTSPTPGTLVAPTAATLRATLATGATYCMEPGFAWGPITLDACTATNVPTVNYSVVGLSASFAFDASTRELSLAAGTTVVPSYTTAMPVTYTCTSADDPTVTASVTLNFNDCDGGGVLDNFEVVRGEVSALVDGVGFLPLTPRTIGTYLPDSATANARLIRTNLYATTGMNVLDATDDSTTVSSASDIDGDGLTNSEEISAGTDIFIATSDASLTGSVLTNTMTVDSAASGDLNNDGYPDLLIGRTDARISTYLSAGASGTFGAAVNNTFLGPTQEVSDMVVFDLNRDGNLDVAAALPNDNMFLTGTGDGTGSIKLEQSIPILGANPRHLVASDFNKDGVIDVALVVGQVLRIYLTNPTSYQLALTTSYALAGAAPMDMAAADYNGDGNMDLAIPDSGADNVEVYLGQADGTFALTGLFAAGGEPDRIANADFDNDGNIDIGLSTTSIANDLQILLGNGDGTFDAVQTWVLQAFRPIALADLDGDGDTDVAGLGGTFLYVFLNQLSETGALDFVTDAAYNIGIATGKITAADYNGDNMTDVALTNQTPLPAPVAAINVFLQ